MAQPSLHLLLAHLTHPNDTQAFLNAFFTDKEREMLTERLHIFRLLGEGKTQREVAAELGCSVVTVTRGAKAYRAHHVFVEQCLALATQPA